MKNRNLNHSDNWETPKDLYDELNQEFNFDFDPCPICFDEITPDKDGLLIEWGKRNFINPPYSRRLKEAFVKRAVEESDKGNLCVCLLPVSTSTALFHDVIQTRSDEIRFIRGRLSFKGVNTFGDYVDHTVKGARAMHDSMIVIFKPTNKEKKDGPKDTGK